MTKIRIIDYNLYLDLSPKIQELLENAASNEELLLQIREEATKILMDKNVNEVVNELNNLPNTDYKIFPLWALVYLFFEIVTNQKPLNHEFFNSFFQDSKTEYIKFNKLMLAGVNGLLYAWDNAISMN